MAKTGDIIEVVKYKHYSERYDVGTHYVVLPMLEEGSIDEWDVPIINTKGKYELICWEEYKVVGNIVDKRQKFLNNRPNSEA